MKPLRKCKNCGDKAIAEADLSRFVPDKNSKHGHRNICLLCRRVQYLEYELSERYRSEESTKKRKDSQRRYYYSTCENRQLKSRDSRLKRTYGISLEDYNQLLQCQESSCAICGRHEDSFSVRLAVDHCHDTGEVRGLLCASCNRGIGYLQDSRNLLIKAISYLNKED